MHETQRRAMEFNQEREAERKQRIAHANELEREDLQREIERLRAENAELRRKLE